jgi:hypothetical protein
MSIEDERMHPFWVLATPGHIFLSGHATYEEARARAAWFTYQARAAGQTGSCVVIPQFLQGTGETAAQSTESDRQRITPTSE